MRILDLFCGVGGAGRGYKMTYPDAEIVGVDISPQPDYPYEFIQADALTFPVEGFDFIHASPPCQGYSLLQTSTGPRLIREVRERISHKPYVIENVAGARRWLEDPITLCGTSFQLPFRRHRLFECSFLVPEIPCMHSTAGDWTDILEGGLDQRSYGRKHGRIRSISVYGRPGPRANGLWQWAMGIDWTRNLDSIAQAIPPAFTAYLGLYIDAPGEGAESASKLTGFQNGSSHAPAARVIWSYPRHTGSGQVTGGGRMPAKPKDQKDKSPDQIAREQAEATRKQAREYVEKDVEARSYTGGTPDMHPFVDSLLVQAADLDDERTALFGRIEANRTMLRNLVQTGAASDEQRAAVEGFYRPRKTKDDGDEPASTNGAS